MDRSPVFLILFCAYYTSGFFFDGIGLSLPKIATVQTLVGQIYGQVENINFDGKYYRVKTFLGIPYAEPPLDKNRFRKPVPKAPFTTPFSALSYGAACLQKETHPYGSMIPLSEDCLFLNVFVPEDGIAPDTKLPVMIWIHGGGFTAGASTEYPAENLSAFGRVIVVTINYRLAHMGFLRTKESFANFGLWDQYLAIKWVKQNIGSFGGDADNITIFGESAGSSSVVYQVLFPGNKGLFQRAIAQSGGITSSWAFSKTNYADDIFRNFTAEVGCNKGDQAVVMSCLRNKTTEEISNATRRPTLNYTNIVPNLDNDFVPRHPQEMIQTSMASQASLDTFYNIDFMMGSCSIDGALFLGYFAYLQNITNLDELKVSRTSFERDDVPSALKGVFSNIKDIPQTVNDLTIFEYTNWTDPNDDKARMMNLVDLITDGNMNAPMVAMNKLHTNGKRRSYMYRFSIAPTTNLIAVPSWLQSPTNANHADDVMFVFGFPRQTLKYWGTTERPIRYTDKDIHASTVVMTMWTNFAKTGDPNKPYSVPTHWPQYNMTSYSYLDITPTMTSSSVKQRIAAKRMALWLDLLPSLMQKKK